MSCVAATGYDKEKTVIPPADVQTGKEQGRDQENHVFDCKLST